MGPPRRGEGFGERIWEQRHDVFGLIVSQRRNNGPNWRNGAWTRIIRMRRTNRFHLPSCGGSLSRFLAAHSSEPHAGTKRGPSCLDPGHRRAPLATRPLRRRGALRRTTRDAFICISCDDERLQRAAAVIEGVFGLRVVRAPGSAARGPAIFVHSGLLLDVLDHLGFHSRRQVDSWLDPRPAAVAPEVVHRGLSGGRWRPLRPEVRRRCAA